MNDFKWNESGIQLLKAINRLCCENGGQNALANFIIMENPDVFRNFKVQSDARVSMKNISHANRLRKLWTMEEIEKCKATMHINRKDKICKIFSGRTYNSICNMRSNIRMGRVA